MITKRIFLSALVAAAVAATGAVHALDAGGVAIQGSLSATGAYSDKYDYYGATGDGFDFNVKEITLNGTYRFENGIRFGAQLYAYDLAGYKDISLDFATIDYAFNQQIGVRVGRNKLPVGLYGEVQDLDQIRTFASLSLNVYPRALRPLTAGYDGAGLYGNIGMGKAGSLEYQAIAGWLESFDGEALYSRSVADLTAADNINPDTIYGGALVWNTPVDGLRFSYTYTFLPDLEMNARVQSRAGLAEVGSSYALVAASIDGSYGEGTWDYSGMFAGSRAITVVDVKTHVASVEYTREKWIFATEYRTMTFEGATSLFGAAPLNAKDSPVRTDEEHWYVQATYQATDSLGLGVYFAQSDYDPKNQKNLDDKFTTMDDIAVAASYAIGEHWLVKVEAHALDGLGKLSMAGDRNLGATDPRWNYFVVKTTFSF
jgi:hypothetical protein